VGMGGLRRTVIEVLNTLQCSVSMLKRTACLECDCTCAVFGGKNSKEKTGFFVRCASASLSLICMFRTCISGLCCPWSTWISRRRWTDMHLYNSRRRGSNCLDASLPVSKQSAAKNKSSKAGVTRHNSALLSPILLSGGQQTTSCANFSSSAREIKALAEVSLTGPAVYQFSRHAPRCSVSL